MKKLSFVLVLLLSAGMVSAIPSIEVPLIGGDPIYTQSNFTPLVFLNQEGGRILEDDPFGVYANGNIAERPNNYAFTGEQISWRILVWDKNGVPEKLSDVYAGWTEQLNGPIPPDQQVNCQYISNMQDGDALAPEYPNVRRPGDQEDQTTFNDQTMGEYLCTMTIEFGCHGQKWMGIVAEDLTGNIGTMAEAESWFCNPELDLTVSGVMDFGSLGPGEQGMSTISVENSAEDGSGAMISLSVSGRDFYDPSSSGAAFPTSNVLKLQGDQTDFTHGFWYSAVQGAESTNGYKRIPYGSSIVDSDPIFSNSQESNQWRKFQGNQFVPMSPGAEATMTFHLGIPQPCNGEFIDGSISLWAIAI